MHTWGEENVDWRGIYDSSEYIGCNLRKWGRVQVTQYKEKFGTVRIYILGLGWRSLHNITHPGHCFSRYPKWLWSLDCKVFSKVIPLLNFIVVPFHKWLYKKLYKDMVKKYPHLKEEITCCADYKDLLGDI
jgi:hypothetical protein